MVRPGRGPVNVFWVYCPEMKLETTASRIWKRLGREDRLAASSSFWRDPPQEAVPAALAAIVSARRVRPQVARTLPTEVRAQTLAVLQEPGEAVAAALLVALHLSERRALLGAFLDAVGVAHDNGIMSEEPGAPVGEDVLRRGVDALSAFPRPQVEAYLNTLFLQDPERWAALPKAVELL